VLHRLTYVLYTHNILVRFILSSMMASFRSVALSGLLFVTGQANGSRLAAFRSLQEESSVLEESEVGSTFSHGKDCVPCSGDTNECVIKVKVNIFAGETGTRFPPFDIHALLRRL
jgi:hypothetical protein